MEGSELYVLRCGCGLVWGVWDEQWGMELNCPKCGTSINQSTDIGKAIVELA